MIVSVIRLANCLFVFVLVCAGSKYLFLINEFTWILAVRYPRRCSMNLRIRNTAYVTLSLKQHSLFF